MDLRLFDYSLPERFIAQKPIDKRDHSRLLIIDRNDSRLRHDIFYNLGDHLNKGDVLVINNSRVTRCRLFGKKEKTEASIECFVLEKERGRVYQVLLRPSKRLKAGDRVYIGGDDFQVLEKLERGRALVEFSRPAEEVFAASGQVPLPPYIRSADIDGDRYQTVYADREGSAAAPTAGLHFTADLMDRLSKKGILFASLSLDIGPGTFRPVSCRNIEEHKMHEEYYSIDDVQAGLIESARKENRRIIAVGTTSARVLEAVMAAHGMIKKSSGRTGIYIYPPYRFRAVDAMITNFHLPRSTLLIMISAFAGRKKVLEAYREAMEKEYRFYSFGDCMLII
jgi:S-adenosylmethionine:tRNA ribosyltransferase-isomerase